MSERQSLKRIIFIMANPLTSAIHSGPLAIPPAGILAVAGYCRERFPHVDFKLRDFGAEQLELAEQIAVIKEYDPQIVAMGARSFIYPASLRLGQAIKEHLPHVRIVLGGQHVTLMPENEQYPESLDCILRGEGEVGFATLLEKFEAGEEWPKVYTAPYLDDLSHPMAWDIIEKPEIYARSMSPFNPDPMGSVVWSRGCPFNCFFCSGPALWKDSSPRVRYRTPDSICDELEYLINELGLSRIFVHDDTLNANPKKLTAILKEIIRRGLKIEWAAAGMRANLQLTPPELFPLMHEAGCRMISYGIETGVAEVLKKLNRQVSHEEGERALRLTKEHGIKTGAGFTIGHIWREADGTINGETREQVEQTISYLDELVSAQLLWSATVSIVDPVPGSALWDAAKEQDLLLLDNFEDLLIYDRVRLNYKHPHLSMEEVDDLYLKAYRTAVFNPNHMLYILKEIHSFKDFVGVARVALYMIKNRLFAPLRKISMLNHEKTNDHQS